MRSYKQPKILVGEIWGFGARRHEPLASTCRPSDYTVRLCTITITIVIIIIISHHLISLLLVTHYYSCKLSNLMNCQKHNSNIALTFDPIVNGVDQ